jgi:hypothetical protein
LFSMNFPFVQIISLIFKSLFRLYRKIMYYPLFL